MGGAILCGTCITMAAKASYPYTAHDGTRLSSFTAGIPRSGITGFKSVGNFLFGGSKSDIRFTITQQPESVAIEADQCAFQACKSVALLSDCSTRHDQGALAAGYGTVNSWPPRWKHACAFQCESCNAPAA